MNEPKPTDVVLGGNSSSQVPINAAVLGGLEGIKRRLLNGTDTEKIAALSSALNYKDAGLALICEVVKNETAPVYAEVKKLSYFITALEECIKARKIMELPFSVEQNKLSELMSRLSIACSELHRALLPNATASTNQKPFTLEPEAFQDSELAIALAVRIANLSSKIVQSKRLKKLD